MKSHQIVSPFANSPKAPDKSIPKRVIKLLASNLRTPTEKEQDLLIKSIRKLTMDESEVFYRLLVQKKILRAPFPLANSEKRLQGRSDAYIRSLYKIASRTIKTLPKKGLFCDIGCGTGAISVGVLRDFLANKGTIVGCDIVDYLNSSVKPYITFKKKNALDFLKESPSFSFDGVLEVVMLHHLPSRQKYKICLKEMVRVAKHNGLILIVETVHTSWYELLKNAVLDKVLNDRTSKFIGDTNAIPVPIHFFSDQELTHELRKYKLTLLSKTPFKPNRFDPKFHMVYICQKQ